MTALRLAHVNNLIYDKPLAPDLGRPLPFVITLNLPPLLSPSADLLCLRRLPSSGSHHPVRGGNHCLVCSTVPLFLICQMLRTSLQELI
jgi:hypothetical protein